MHIARALSIVGIMLLGLVIVWTGLSDLNHASSPACRGENSFVNIYVGGEIVDLIDSNGSCGFASTVTEDTGIILGGTSVNIDTSAQIIDGDYRWTEALPLTNTWAGNLLGTGLAVFGSLIIIFTGAAIAWVEFKSGK